MADLVGRLDVAGMTCSSCGEHVAAALADAGAHEVRVDWRAGTAQLGWPAAIAEDALVQAVADAGYRPGSLTQTSAALPMPAAAADHSVDLVILGSGSAAFAAAIRASEAGHRVVMVEHGTVGGTCVNVGCVPSKALLRAAETYWTAGHHPFAGIGTAAGDVDLPALVAQKDDLVGMLRRHKYLDLVDSYGFEVLAGHGRFADADTVAIAGQTLRPRAVLIATGALPALPPIPGLAEAGYLTSTAALDLKSVPERLAVIGANAIGLELGQFFVHLGSQVTFLDVAERIAPFEEPEVSAALSAVIDGQGATIHTAAQISHVEHAGGSRRIHFHVDGAAVCVDVDEILVATGRRPSTADLGLDAAGITTDSRGAVIVDATLATSNPRVWAAGDVTSAPQFVYVAAYQGVLAADNALGGGRHVDLSGLPRVMFTSPPVAAAGLTETQARAEGYDVKTAVLDLAEVSRAIVNRATDGLIKLVADTATDRLLGASIVADGAGDAIQTAVMAIRYGITTSELAATFHPYLTTVEGIKLAAQTFTRDVTKLSCCAA